MWHPGLAVDPYAAEIAVHTPTAGSGFIAAHTRKCGSGELADGRV
ncbi:hypothetical protein [Kitasatospora sp. NPDC098663]